MRNLSKLQKCCKILVKMLLTKYIISTAILKTGTGDQEKHSSNEVAN